MEPSQITYHFLSLIFKYVSSFLQAVVLENSSWLKLSKRTCLYLVPFKLSLMLIRFPVTSAEMNTWCCHHSYVGKLYLVCTQYSTFLSGEKVQGLENLSSFFFLFFLQIHLYTPTDSRIDLCFYFSYKSSTEQTSQTGINDAIKQLNTGGLEWTLGCTLLR